MQAELSVQEQLAALLENKLAAMRDLDVTRLDALSKVERQVVEQARIAGAKRQHAATVLTQALLGGGNGRAATARELAAAADEPLKSQLLSLAGMLAEAVQKSQRLNRVVDVAARKVLGHVEQVFRMLAQSGREIGLYGRQGRRPMTEQNSLIDAMA